MAWIIDGRHVIVHRNVFVEQLGLITCGVRMRRDFGAGKARQRCGAGKVAVRDQQGRRLKHESGKGETERHDMHNATNLFMTLSP